MRSVRGATVAQVAAAMYLQIIEWVPLFPWNNLTHGNGQAGLDIALAVVMGLAAAGTYARNRFAMGVAVAVYAVWLALQIQTWWVPYFFGGSASWRRVYAFWFARTTRFLPAIGDHPVPDAAHCLLQVLLLVALVLTIRQWLIIRSSTASELRQPRTTTLSR